MPAAGRSSGSESALCGLRLTVDEWIALDRDARGELVDGILVEEEMPDYLHEVVVMWLGHVLSSWLGDRPGFVAGSDAKFVLAGGRGRKPDLSVFLPGSKLPPKRGAIRVAPDIAVEVISVGAREVRRDRVDKMNEYAGFGVRWYWILDPEARVLEIYGRDGRGLYVREVGVSEGHVEVPGCEGLTLDLDALWRKIDSLPDE